jgi:multiple sugar transport system permease protein
MTTLVRDRAPQVRRAERRGNPARWRSRRLAGAFGLVLTLPAMVLFAAFAVYPGLRVFYLSLFDYNLTSEPEFVGLGNFEFLVGDAGFRAVVGQTLFYVVGTYVPAIGLALALALALQRAWFGSALVRLAYFLPIAMSWVAVTIIWRMVFHPDGMANQVLGVDVNWLTSNTSAKWALVIMSIWKETGFFLILLIAGLRTVPEDVIEAATLDGAGPVRRFVSMTLPLIAPVLAVCAVMATIRGFQSFSAQVVLTGGAFGTEVLNLFIYQTAFASARMGRASAVAVLMFFALLALTLVQLAVFRRRDR